MSDVLLIFLTGIFLPLFPMSMVFNALIDRMTEAWQRIVIFLIWPLCGIFLVFIGEVHNSLPEWVLWLALFTSALYALRMLSLREVNQWSGFLAVSLWSLLWLPIYQTTPTELLLVYAISMTTPLILLLLLCTGLEQRFGAAYTGLDWGLARTIPNFSMVLGTVVIAAIATPLFPPFFIMFDMVVESLATIPAAALILLLIWLLWSWAGARLLQGLIVGRTYKNKVPDMDVRTISLYAVALFVLFCCGMYLGGVIL